MRSKPASIRFVAPDPIYHSVALSKLINQAMHSGKKNAIQKQVYSALEIVRSQTGQDPLPVVMEALENIKPQMEVRARRIGGAAYQIPVPVRGSRKDSLAIRWLIQAARSRPNTGFPTFASKLAAEIMEAVNNSGIAIKKKLDTHRMAEANKAFAHFRW